MTQQFTASEVRDYLFSIEERSSRQWLIAHDAELGMLRQFADLLESQEKAVPVAWRTFDGEGNYDYRDYENNEHYRDRYVSRNGAKYANWVEPLYTHPAPSDVERRETMTPRELAKRIERGEKWKLADEPTPCQSRDAEMLAEALRGILEIGKRNMENQKYDGFFNAARAALAAHSAQAQPPYELDPAITEQWENGELGRSLEYAQVAQPPAARVTDAMVARAQVCLHDKGKDIGYYHMRAALEAALAAQENLNG